MTSRSMLDLDDIQGNVLRGYRLPHVAHVFGTVREANAHGWRAALRALAISVERGATKPRVTRNVGVSYAGMALLVPQVARDLARFEAYASGMGARAELLGDPPSARGAPWDDRHVWIAAHAADEESLAAEVTRLRTACDGLLEPSVLMGRALVSPDGHWREPFGFRDDISQPAVDGAPNERKLLRGGGKLDAANDSWLPIAAGEFVLGYPNERRQNVLSKLPELAPLLMNGTFAVFRELVQDVTRFHETMAAAAAAWHVSVDELKASLVGRYADGEPLAARGSGEKSDFTYDDDPRGARCPLGAHVRRANPRVTGEHRVIRRGMPYRRGADDAANGGADVQGMYLVVLNASIESQFEFVQSRWLNGPVGALPGSRDPLASAAAGCTLIEGDAALNRDPIVLNLRGFVSCRGGQYYLLPGLRGLQWLAGGRGGRR